MKNMILWNRTRKKKKGSKEKINRDKEDKNLDRSISERHVIVRKSTITSSLGLGKKPHSSQELLDSVSISSQEDVAFKESFWRIFSSDEKFKAQLKDVLLRDILELVDQQKKEIESLKAEVKKLQRQWESVRGDFFEYLCCPLKNKKKINKKF